MDVIEVVILLGFLALFGVIIFFMFRAEYQARNKKVQISQSLGFKPLVPNQELTQKMNKLYQSLRSKQAATTSDNYELENVFIKQLPDGQMILFDLIDPSGEDNSYLENQAVAIISPQLNLPPFLVFPQADQEGALANVANKVLGWLVSQISQPVEFSRFPEFQQRYLVSSPAPEATRQFLDEYKLRRLANTSHLTIHARENIFTCAHIDVGASSLSIDLITARVQQALELFSIFQS